VGGICGKARCPKGRDRSWRCGGCRAVYWVGAQNRQSFSKECQAAGEAAIEEIKVQREAKIAAVTIPGVR
jgi:hypothetical protein